ncbi:MAG: cation diffusion facilitator family transporter [Chloroherpetonaceae bacterium]|nr:cation diffusion facilitator family transporter [Chloroherpetonaceae bacterium]
MEHNHRIYEEKLAQTKTADKGIKWAWLITFGIFFIELFGGIISGSLALLADAAHMAVDVLALGIGYFAVWITRKPATPRRTYGFYRVEILAALLNGILLILISLAVAYEAFERFFSGVQINSLQMFGFGFLGLIANIFSALVLHKEKDSSVNLKAAYLHVLGDLAGSVGVISGALLIYATGSVWIDPFISLFITLLIIRSAWRVVTESIDVLLESAPIGVKCEEVEAHLRAQDRVVDLHDLHIWTITSGVNALSCHIVINNYECSESLILSLNHSLKDRFNIDHVTIQLENAEVRQKIDHLTIQEVVANRGKKNSTPHHIHHHHTH